MKVALITDTHFGARSDNLALLDYQKKFYDTVFFPYLDEHYIHTVFHLGDLVDRRKYINVNTANRMRKDFIEPLNGRDLHIIPGNHDVYYKNSNEINSLKELLGDKENIKIYMQPTVITVDKAQILMLPWICDENRKQCFNAISKAKAPILFGHLELVGFEMHKGHFCDVGLHKESFEKFDVVCSGHFHHKSTYQNINYLGSPYEMTWADYGDVKGFYTFDTETYELEFIENPLRLFQKVHYSDSKKGYEKLLDVDYSYISNTYVKVIVKDKTNPFFYDRFIQKLEDQGPVDIKAVDDHLNIALDDDSDIINQAESTLEILSKTIDQSGIEIKYKKPLENLLRTLYNEASILQA